MTIKLFVADDSVTIQKIVSLAFSGEDIEIKSVSDGSSALDSVRTFRPDVVLADVFMPGCSGYEVCAQIKQDPELADTPVVLMVGTFEPFDQSEASRVKCDGFLTKPFDTSELIRTVHTLVRDKKMPPQEVTSDEITGTCPAAPPPAIRATGTRPSVSAAARESFLGEGRILDILEIETPPETGSGAAQPAAVLSEDCINLIVDRVVSRMSVEVIREVAWEVVPELSESIIRSTVEEYKN